MPVIPDPVAWGHVLMLLGLIAGLYGLWQASIFLKHRGAGRGTPQYARRRDGRRYAAWSLAAGAILFALGCLTPLSEMAIG
jgi:hypothetical protein